MKKQVKYSIENWSLSDLNDKHYEVGKIETNSIILLGDIEDTRIWCGIPQKNDDIWYYRIVVFNSGFIMTIFSKDSKELEIVGWDYKE